MALSTEMDVDASIDLSVVDVAMVGLVPHCLSCLTRKIHGDRSEATSRFNFQSWLTLFMNP